MTSNQRRPGFRLPWSADDETVESGEERATTNGSSPHEGETAADEAGAEASAAESPAADAPVADAPATTSEESELEAPAASGAGAASTATVTADAPVATATTETDVPGDLEQAAAAAAGGEPSTGFMRDLVAAMRRVAEETRQSSLAELRASSEERVRALEADTEQRREELRSKAEADIAGVGEWARAEEARIKQEAEQKVVSRRAQLDQQLAAETSRAEAETQALRDRVAVYERDLDAYHAQLSDIADPAAFAAAAKRMPPPPQLASGATAAPSTTTEPEPAEAAAEPAPANGDADAATSVPQPDLAREAADATQPVADEATGAPAQAGAASAAEQGADAATAERPSGETVATEVLVKGLGSFGAITGFRQALAGVEGIEGVSLSLGPTGEFVFRAIHPAGFDVGAAIMALEGDAAKVEERSEGGLRVTLERAR